uniref:phosphoribosylformylglycinamidine synthase n=2 Tax=Ascaris suum TaxID=6253 RepID=F1KRI4_ASCSU
MSVEKHHLRYYVPNDDDEERVRIRAIEKAISATQHINVKILSETCFHVIIDAEIDVEAFESEFFERLSWLLRKNPFGASVSKKSTFTDANNVFEIGPRTTFTSPFSTNAVSACHAASILPVTRLERSIRYQILCEGKQLDRESILPLLHDKMTECEYNADICFEKFDPPKKVQRIDLLSSIDNLHKANTELGLAFDDADIQYYYDLFANKMQRNPTDVELFDLAQSNSEHSRHTFFKGRLVVDGIERKETLFASLRATQSHSHPNNVIAFSDNSSAIRGFDLFNLVSLSPCTISEIAALRSSRHIIYSAETHNFPTGVCPFPGAATGTGGRIRDIHATGRGAHEIAGVVGYAFGNLHLDGYELPWEDNDFQYGKNFAHPREVLIQASNGASDYGNKFGEPVICGFTRSFGQRLSTTGERCEYVKPILFSGGIGSIEDSQKSKVPCSRGMLLAKIGGPAYRIGLGGGAASSVAVQGDSNRYAELDFNAVQRGDPEMEQKLHRVVRACVEYGENNPILSIHDQGAGGNGNVLKELVDGEEGGAVIEASRFPLGDPTISIRELWGAEYQENDAILLHENSIDTIQQIAKREKCNVSLVGRVTGDRKVVVLDYKSTSTNDAPVNLDLDLLGNRPPKVFHLESVKIATEPLQIPSSLSTQDALALVLRLPSVASKRFLTNKVDRSVTGLIAQQQCVGPLQTPVADVAVVAFSYWHNFGAAVAVGEQPIKGIVNAEAGARMSLAEALTNLVFAGISHRKDVKCSGNWMWAAKLRGEGARLVTACDALCDAMKQVGVAIDGGKDSLSMAAKVNGELVKAPGTLVLSAYAPCPNVARVVTPDLKGAANGGPSRLIYVRFGNDGSQHRLGGTALAQCLKQLGDTTCDIEDFDLFTKAFDITQVLIKGNRILAGHDVSDGGLIVCVLEMAFAGNRSFVLQMCSTSDAMETLFAEECGIVIEVEDNEVDDILRMFHSEGVHTQCIGFTTQDTGRTAMVIVNVNGETALSAPLCELRELWEQTSDQLELLQTSQQCAKQQQHWIKEAGTVEYRADFDYSTYHLSFLQQKIFKQYAVAILREEGSNGDREMAAAFHMAGFTPFDVTMTDLLDFDIGLERFCGLAFVGGFSYGDVLGSAKGWASSILFHQKLFNQFETFRRRKDTFSLGVCNGCQLMALLGWIGTTNNERAENVFLKTNDCGRYQSCFSTVVINRSPSIMLAGMEDSVLGVWCAHGEGKFCYRHDEILDELEANQLVPIQYCNGAGKPSMIFPENPNGSARSVAALCSMDGRHLGMMPHPERSFVTWQWPNYPKRWKSSIHNNNNSPWMRMFINAYKWVQQPSSA